MGLGALPVVTPTETDLRVGWSGLCDPRTCPLHPQPGCPHGPAHILTRTTNTTGQLFSLQTQSFLVGEARVSSLPGRRAFGSGEGPAELGHALQFSGNRDLSPGTSHATANAAFPPGIWKQASKHEAGRRGSLFYCNHTVRLQLQESFPKQFSNCHKYE